MAKSILFYHRLAFGCRSSPKIFDLLSQAICWIAANNYGLEKILHLLDDFLVISKPMENGNQVMTCLKDIFNRLNVPISLPKTVGPCTIIEYLGIILDSTKMEARLPADKIQRITEFLHTMENKHSCTKRQMLQLLGHLNFAMRVILPGRAFVSYLIAVTTQVKELHHHIHINHQCRKDIGMWKLFLSQWNGISNVL